MSCRGGQSSREYGKRCGDPRVIKCTAQPAALHTAARRVEDAMEAQTDRMGVFVIIGALYWVRVKPRTKHNINGRLLHCECRILIADPLSRWTTRH